ncbi:MAG: response regulator transcription factor [Leptospiraceae bacterium]|nr:response regulator transcription factor [Leptospiraceae bacterium]
MTIHSEFSVSIIEDNSEAAKRIQSLIAGSPDFVFYDHYSSAEQAIRKLPARIPCLVLVDINLPGIDGAECIRRLRSMPGFTAVRLVVLTVFEDANTIIRSIQNGANGYLLKDISSALLLAELKVACLGGAAMNASIAEGILQAYFQPVAATEPNPLSPRENEVINYISLGMTYNEIANELSLSAHTVRRHIENIYRKLEVNSRSQAIQRSHEIGLLPANPPVPGLKLARERDGAEAKGTRQ